MTLASVSLRLMQPFDVRVFRFADIIVVMKGRKSVRGCRCGEGRVKKQCGRRRVMRGGSYMGSATQLICHRQAECRGVLLKLLRGG